MFDAKSKYTDAIAKALADYRPQIMMHVKAISTMNDPGRETTAPGQVIADQKRQAVAKIDIEHYASGLTRATVFDMQFPLRKDAPMPDAHISCRWSPRTGVKNGGEAGKFLFLTESERTVDAESINPGIADMLHDLDATMTREVHLFALAQLFAPYFNKIYQ